MTTISSTFICHWSIFGPGSKSSYQGSSAGNMSVL